MTSDATVRSEWFSRPEFDKARPTDMDSAWAATIERFEAGPAMGIDLAAAAKRTSLPGNPLSARIEDVPGDP